MLFYKFEAFLFDQKSSESLYIFDLDDTLVISPNFNDLVIDFLNENYSIKDILLNCLSEVEASISDLKYENGRIFINNNNQILNSKNWFVKGSRIYLIAPQQFNLSNISLPKQVNTEIADIYRSAKNKAIVTARSIKLKDKIIKTLEELNLEYPNKGLFMYPGNAGTTPIWKSNIISSLIKEHNPLHVYFYEDNTKTSKEVDKKIHNLYPSLDYKSTKVEIKQKEVPSTPIL